MEQGKQEEKTLDGRGTIISEGWDAREGCRGRVRWWREKGVRAGALSSYDGEQLMKTTRCEASTRD